MIFKSIGAAAAILVAGIIAWLFFYPSTMWRYRLTLEIETPDGLKTGSGVIQINAARQPKVTPESLSAAVGARGEAVIVDLGNAGPLFATLTSPDLMSAPYKLVFDIFPWNGGQGGEFTPEGMAYYTPLRAKAEVPIGKLPLLVRFRNPTDPQTVQVVDPSDLSRAFGPGFHFKSAEIEMVDQGLWPLNAFGLTGEPVTRRIRDFLPWLSQYPEPGVISNADRSGKDTRPEIKLIHGHFTR